MLESEVPIYEYISESKIKNLQNSPAWEIMFSSEYFDFNTMSSIRDLILKIGDQLNKIRVNI